MEIDSLMQEINNLYGLDAKVSDKITVGFLSENWVLVSGDEKYFLKKYGFNDEEKIKNIHLVKKYFSDGGIPVVLPILNKNDRTFFSFQGEYFALFPFVEGRYIAKSNLNNKAIVSLGETMGKMHLLGKKAALPLQEEFKGWNKEKLLQKGKNIIYAIKKTGELNDFDKLAMSDVEWRMSKIESNSITFKDLRFKNDHLIHGDYHEGNVFFDDSDHVSHVFDLEKTAYAPRVYELWRSIFFMFFSGNVTSKSLEQGKLYLKSYLNIYPAPKSELERGFKLFYLRFLHSFWIPAEHYLKNNYRVDKLLAERFAVIKYISENFEELESKLLS